MNEWDSNEKRRRWRGRGMEGRRGTGHSGRLAVEKIERGSNEHNGVAGRGLYVQLCLLGSSGFTFRRVLKTCPTVKQLTHQTLSPVIC